MKIKSGRSGIWFATALILLFSCVSKNQLPVAKYYDYDFDLPLEDTVRLINEYKDHKIYSLEFSSVHNQRVKGLLTIPKSGKRPLPVIILLHGLGDSKTVDYIEAGHDYFVNAGFAVLRIDIANHGDRKLHNYEFDLIDDYRYWTRDMVTQTVFDLRRSIDFLETREEIDHDKIGFFGISLGGVIGSIFCGVDARVKVPVIALAGGNLSLMFGLDAFSEETKDFFSIIDPINFIADIAPRPLLMINAKNDEIIAPATSKLLFLKAEHPKEIIWYPSKHRDLPIEEAYPAGIEWFKKHF